MKKFTLLLLFFAVLALGIAVCNSKKLKQGGRKTAEIEKITVSWYGPRFHGRRTASGVIYDMFGVSAAHRRLPFGTKIFLYNPVNRASITVRINDRGPYINGRDLDISYGAATQLGMVQAGVVQLYAQIVP